jgi:hypothetical protein
VINPQRDLRLSFPDPMTSSREELSNTSYEDILSPVSGATFPDPDITVHLTEPEEPITIDPVPPLLDSDMNITLYGLSHPPKWSIVSKLLEKVVRGARLTIATPLEQMDGPVRQLHVEGGTDRGIIFPRIITVIDRTSLTQDDKEDVGSIHPFTRRLIATPCSHFPKFLQIAQV